jgi:hypothetical protein
LPVILDRNRRRKRPAPEKVIQGLAAKCDPPTWTEAHCLTIVCDGAGNPPKAGVMAAKT